jgi:DNA-binding NarL/FixJ family response regulator
MSKVRVIVLTASVHRQDIDAALLAGADQFVPKPCAGDALVLHVARALDGSRPSARIRRVVP